MSDDRKNIFILTVIENKIKSSMYKKNVCMIAAHCTGLRLFDRLICYGLSYTNIIIPVSQLKVFRDSGSSLVNFKILIAIFSI